MAESSTVTILRQKIVDIEDAISKYERQIVLARQDLAAVSATLSIFTRPEGAPKSQEATFSVRKLYRRNEVSTFCLDALRGSPAGLDTRQLAAICLKAKGYDPSNHVLARSMAMTIVQFLSRFARMGKIEKAGMREQAIVWRMPKQS